jgi:hypothetical protein
MSTCELRPIVRANLLRAPTNGNDLFQHTRHAPAGKACVYFQCQALTGEGIYYA